MEYINFFLHLNDSLRQIIVDYGAWTYAILFVIIFCETGLVVTPFLPGDSLLFAAGALSVHGAVAASTAEVGLNLPLVMLVLAIAAVLGDAANYSIGYFCGPRLRAKGKLRFIKQEYLDRTHQFYEKHGKMTIILARFVPIIRTFAPFMAGVGSMRYWEFAIYNITGGLLWVILMTMSGYVFGGFPFVKKHFELIVLMIIFISMIPVAFEWYRQARANKQQKDPGTPGS